MLSLLSRLTVPIPLGIPWRLVVVVVLVASAAGLGYVEGLTHEQVRSARAATAQAQQAAADITRLQQQARDTERQHAEAVAAISTDYEGRLHDLDTRRAADRAALLAGALRLRDPGAPVRPGDCAAAPAPAPSGGRDGPAPGELSPAAAGFLLDLADDADRVAEQLATCQRVVMEDRREGVP